jgi:lipopolysaccharide biosynthesis protein
MKVCLFAQYDPTHRIRPHVIDYIRALTSAGFRVAVACSSDFRPPPSDLAPLTALGVPVLWRPNVGLDFGAWQHLIREGHADNASAVLLTNDSVFGPFGDLGRVVRRMCSRGYDAWGMVESWQRCWHLQSWFVYLSAAAFSRPSIRALFDQPFDAMTKDEIVERGELALGQALRSERLRCGPASRRLDRRIIGRLASTNPTHVDWRYLLLSRRVPFIKAELVRDNPMAIPWAREWHDVISRRLGYETDSINAFLHEYAGSPEERRSSPFQPPSPLLPWRLFLHYVLVSADWRVAMRYAPDIVRSHRDAAQVGREHYGRTKASLRAAVDAM